MSSYKAPERNTAVFIGSRFPKKIVATDHIHEDINGKGDVTAIGDNVFQEIMNSQVTIFLAMKLHILLLLHTRLMGD